MMASYESAVQRWIDGLAGIPGVAASRAIPMRPDNLLEGP